MKGWGLSDLAQSEAGKLEANKHLLEPEKKGKKRAKYGNNKIEWEGLLFDSTKEYKRFRELLVMLKHGEITYPERQVIYVLIEANETEQKCEYWADFRYRNVKTGELIVEDVKSPPTRKKPSYVMKRKLMKSLFNIEIKEI